MKDAKIKRFSLDELTRCQQVNWIESIDSDLEHVRGVAQW